MKKYFSIMTTILLVLSVIPVIAIDTGVGVGINVDTEDFLPLIWMCDSRIVYDDPVESGRVSSVDKN
jgi:hypothetical protein